MNTVSEKIHCNTGKNSYELSVEIAARIAKSITNKTKVGKQFVLGCCTGLSPIGVYQELVRLHKEGKLDFSNVILFNLDEYYPISSTNTKSFNYFLHEHLVRHVNIQKANVHFVNGSRAEIKQLKMRYIHYENAIKRAGGVDLQLLGMGKNGHIGFNEPGSLYTSGVRRITLTTSSRQAHKMEFDGLQNVPAHAITVGIRNILEAKEIILMAWGESKAKAVRDSVEKEPTEQCPASLLQHHHNAIFYLDMEAASKLTRYQKPWLSGDISWTRKLMKKAVVRMALALEKPLLSLTHQDYIDHGLSDLLVELEGSYYEANLKVFYMMRDSITGWPGGKEGTSKVDDKRPERPTPFPKKVLIFSPHPDDDIISMGGTFLRLHEQGHEVHVGYQTSGNVAVSDSFVVRLLNFVYGVEKQFGIPTKITQDVLKKAKAFLKVKQGKEKDTDAIRAVKGLIRKYEAIATCNYVGLADQRAHFMNLPFYETGKIEKNKPTQKDIDITKKLLRKIQPHQVYAAGDIADPHGTHKVCLEILLEALKQLKEEKEPWINQCWLWLYKGAWQEWYIEEIEMAVPMSPEQILIKRHGIFLHQSQKDEVPFLGEDAREFWQRSEARNKNTADLYAQLGLPQYAAMEAFVRTKF